MCRSIAMNSGHAVIVDDSDFEEFSCFRWSSLETGGLVYARRTIRLGSKQKTILLHRLIAAAKDGEFVDHINGNGLDCRKENLRIVTKHQNNINKRVKRDSRTGIKGVRKHSLCDKFSAEIKPPNGKRIYLGLFPTIETAAAAYDAASKMHHGEFRRAK